MKRILRTVCIFVAFVMALGAITFAAGTLTLKNANYPTTIEQGHTFSVYGEVTSSYKISSVTCRVTDTSGNVQFTRTVNPGAYSYSLHDLDYYMTFSKLKAGSYRYRVKASDSQSSDVVLLDKSFSVVSSSPSLQLTGANYPTSYVAGNTFSVKGTITSSRIIKSVTAGAYDGSGKAMFSKTVYPEAYSYSLSSLDYYMTFSKLAAGSYRYVIKATDTVSSDVKLLDKAFTVTEPSSGTGDMNSVKWDVADISYWNEITSWSSFAKEIDGVILRLGYRSTGRRTISADTTFSKYYTSAVAQGLHVGCYFFSNALNTSEAVEEAKYVLKVLKDNKCKMDMPIYIDMETDAQVNLTRRKATDIARAFCNEIKNNGYYPGVYCNTSFARDELYASELADVTFWIAQYAAKCAYTGKYGMWQYSEYGSYPGTKGYVDKNYCYCDYPSYIKNNGLNGYPAQAPKASFSVKTSGSVKTDTSANIIYGVPEGLGTAEFSSAYLKYENVKITYTGAVNGKVATGTAVSAADSQKTIASYTISVRGDVNSDGAVNSTDALSILQAVVGGKAFNKAQQLAADFDGNGSLNSNDALALMVYFNGKKRM
ncbi:MAG: hypothetical protein IJT03_00250 [Clostridia bacterium]|nr:hypothetical protein [Clostridia bacterium]